MFACNFEINTSGSLKVAAQTYRQRGNDFFPGPLDNAGQVSPAACSSFDQFWEVKGEDIDDLLVALELNNGTVSASDVAESILQWPGRNNQYFTDFVFCTFFTDFVLGMDFTDVALCANFIDCVCCTLLGFHRFAFLH